MTQQAQGNQHQATAAGAPPAGQLYDVGGRRLWLHRSGSGGPAVVFLAGASAVGLDYLNLHDRVCEFTTSVLYDCGGTGWSDPAELPRTAAEVATELRDLLRAAGVPGRYCWLRTRWAVPTLAVSGSAPASMRAFQPG
jgi:pimeloyl-ACP methyl ester carboxylesterase